MKFISWNVNGLRAAAGKGFSDAFKALDADFFCLQETKMQEGQLDLSFDGYTSFWNSAEKKGYSGTAIFTRKKPLSVRYGMGVEEHDHEGRIVTLEMPDFYLVCVYVPNSQDGLRRLDYRMRWEDDFRRFVLSLDKPVVICGDLNVAHEEIDIKNPASNRRNAGFTDEEREKFSVLLDSGFTDTWRAHSILKKSNTLGGHIGSMPEKITRDGESTISLYPIRSAIKSSLQISTTRFSVRTTAL